MGSELHLWHMAGAARPAGNRRRYDSGLDFTRTRLARELPKQRRRLGWDLWHVRKTVDQRGWPKQRIPNPLGSRRHMCLQRFGSAERPTWFRLSSSLAKARRLMG